VADIVITDEDRSAAEAFMQSFLEDLFPDADFARGSITRDHTIGAVAAVVSFFRAEARNTRSATSLRSAEDLEGVDFTQAVENIVANWFVTRREGTRVRGIVTLSFSNPHDGFIPATANFIKATGVVFFPDSTTGIAFASQDLSPRTDSTGEIIDYTLDIPVVAAAAGTIYQITAGPFASFTQFDAFLVSVENANAFTGGGDAETAEELLRRVPGAISVRDLNSDRSIQAVLEEEFPEIERMLVIGMAEAGMQRDVLQLLAPEIIIHLGGYIDVYISTEIVEQRTFEAVVGGVFSDPRLEITLFRDATVDDWRDFNVVAGDVLRIQNAGSSEAALYHLRAVTKHYLMVSAKQAFPAVRPIALRLDEDGNQTHFTGGVTVSATNTITLAAADFTQDDVGKYVRITVAPTPSAVGDYQISSVDEPTETATLVAMLPSVILGDDGGVEFDLFEDLVLYSIGDSSPSYENKIATASTGEFSRDYQEVGHVLLPGEPIYLIREVSILDPADPDANALTGRVVFPNRANIDPAPLEGDLLEYRMSVKNPLEHQSSRQLATIDIGYAKEQEGANGVLNNSDRFTDAGALFTAGDVGKRIRILDAVLDNNRGEFEIATFVGPNTVDLLDPDNGGWSSLAETRLNWELTHEHKYDGKTMRVVYDTIVNFDVVDSFVSERSRRVVCADTLTRGYHPAYLEFELVYRIAENATDIASEDEIKAFLTDFINAFPSNDVIHASDIVTAVQSNFGEIGSIRLPITISYNLLAPDGRSIPYVTQDAVELDVARLASPAPADRLEDPEELGVVDDNVRYLTDEDLITLTLVE
jgi:hypothetical protein